MQINEIFSSIDGEGIRTGYLVTFIRTQFCSLSCIFCDTSYSLTPKDENGNLQYKNMTVDEIITQVEKLGNKRITFTGGEPLIQLDAEELVEKLTQKGYEVNIETNGAVDLKSIVTNKKIDQSKVIYTMDWKSPYSGMRDKMVYTNLDLLKEKDVLKFVVGTLEDLEDMKTIVTRNNLKCSIFISPVFGKIEPVELVKYIQNNNLQNVRVQLQLHKLIWPVDMRGV